MKVFEGVHIRLPRPLLWGFFVSTILIVVLVLVRFALVSSIKNGWRESVRNREEQIQFAIETAFRKQVLSLSSLAVAVRSDSPLFENLSNRSLENSTEVFERIDKHRGSADISIDVLDAVGNLILWAGDHAGLPVVQGLESRDTLVSLTQTNLHTFLSVAIPIPNKFLSVVIYRVLEVNSPLSNRFVTQTSFTRELSAQLGVTVRFRSSTSLGKTDSSLFVVPLKDTKGGIIGEVSAAVPTLDHELSSIRTPLDKFLSLVGGMDVFFFLVMLAIVVRGRYQDFWQLVMMTCLLLLLRYAWIVIDFPRGFLAGSLFDPSVYASPLGFGLTSSIGETLITVLVFLVNCVLLLTVVCERSTRPRPQQAKPGHFLVAAEFPFLLVLFYWLTHAYGEAIRSLVFDSTLLFHDPTVLVPSGSLAFMHLAILLLSLSYFCLVVVLLVLMVECVKTFLPERTHVLTNLVVVSTALGVVWIVLQLLPLTPKFPVFYPFLPLALGLVAVWFFFNRFTPEESFREFLAQQALWLLVIAFMLALPILDSKLHQKDHERVQILADELLRPVDSWLSVVVNDGLRIAATHPTLLETVRTPVAELHSDIAFSLWSQSLLGREGYNSAVVLYNSSGQEISRFSVGMTSFEQSEMLKAMFNSEEEVLQLVDRKVPGGAVKYYGAWSTVRDSLDTPVAFAAVMLAANQRTLFRGDIPEPLRVIAGERFEPGFRALTVSEFRNGILATTNNPHSYKGMPLDVTVLRYFDDPTNRYLWRTESSDGKQLEILYAQDDSQPDLILAVSLEVLDLRWHLFNIVKILLVYLALLGILIALRYTLRWSNGGGRGIGFRTRLVLAFGLLTSVPVFFIGYYNRQLATERLELTINKELAQDLIVLERRLLQTFDDERDFLNGMTDDYCEAVASELGVDFSVYRSTLLKASSRPELYHASILNPRLPGKAYANAVLVGRNYFQDVETVGDVQYAVGYKPLILDDRIVGVIAVPALYRQAEIDDELARRNAYTVGIYAVVLGVVILGGLVLANRLSGPLRELSGAAKQVGRGNLDVSVEVTSSDEIGELIASFNHMVNELKQNRIQIARAERDLAWKEMAKQVAHEIKNPLTPMKLSIQHLRTAFKDRVHNLDAVVERVTQTVIEQIEALARIATEFSNFARMPERKFERVDVHEVLRETISLFQEIGGVEFRVKFTDTVLTLVADGDELRRVFINLIRNSVQAMERGGSITLETRVEDHRCKITITDTGPGIPQHIQHKVFEPNFSTKTDGTGLGLAICRKIVEDLNGTIMLKSGKGKGTTFIIEIPIQTAS